MVHDLDWHVRWTVARIGRKQDLELLANDGNEIVREMVKKKSGAISEEEFEKEKKKIWK